MLATLARGGQPTCCASVLSETVENYLKTIFHLVSEGEPATTSTIAGRLGVAPPTVSAMVRRLESDDLVTHAGRGRVILTDHGHTHAVAVIRRHRLLETFLHRVLDVPWDEVHDEAEALEHAVSTRLEERIDAALGRPTHDPHGDPIPPRTGAYEEYRGTPLERAEPGSEFLVERVSDRDSAALRYLAERGIHPGARLAVVERAPFDGPLWVRIGAHTHALGPVLTRFVYGRAASEEER